MFKFKFNRLSSLLRNNNKSKSNHQLYTKIKCKNNNNNRFYHSGHRQQYNHYNKNNLLRDGIFTVGVGLTSYSELNLSLNSSIETYCSYIPRVLQLFLNS